MYNNEKHSPLRILHYLAYYAKARERKLATSRVRMMLSVLVPTRGSGISQHCFGQGFAVCRAEKADRISLTVN